jgi:hypothetical protein
MPQRFTPASWRAHFSQGGQASARCLSSSPCRLPWPSPLCWRQRPCSASGVIAADNPLAPYWKSAPVAAWLGHGALHGAAAALACTQLQCLARQCWLWSPLLTSPLCWLWGTLCMWAQPHWLHAGCSGNRSADAGCQQEPLPPLGASFALAFGATTGRIPWNASAASLEAAFTALHTISSVDVARRSQWQWL